MTDGSVGAGILSIITESLYDKPIVVFREYVQNSVDSFRKVEEKEDSNDLVSKIWLIDNNLYFLDNGNGIPKNSFRKEMESIAFSKKKRINDIGYKGIGRLSGLPYCDKLTFVNICSYKNKSFQKYIFDGEKYNQTKAQSSFNELTFEEVIDTIGTFTNEVIDADLPEVESILKSSNEIFIKQDTGFLVILENISLILKQTIETEKKDDFITELGWLLPVKFKDELYKTELELLFRDMTENEKSSVIPAKAYNISFNNVQIERPITAEMLRDYTCKMDFKYAIGFHSFYRDKIAVTRGNKFSGIKLYLDNILLCDETELIPILQRYGLIDHSANELVVTVKGLGVIIYITDKINISANARRTFIEIIDNQSLEFLKILAEFVNSIYTARYALSKYNSEKNVINQSKEKLDQLKKVANDALQKLARDEITIEFEDDQPSDFKEKNEIEQKKVIKTKLTLYMNQKIKDYLLQTNSFDYENAVSDFQIWLSSNI